MTGSVISDAGPLIALAVAGHVEVLRALFSSVMIPETVHKEILEGGVAAKGVSEYRGASWIQVAEPISEMDPLLTVVLGKGEASVIQLARDLTADWVLIDEQKARKIARQVYGLSVIGTARVLVEAKRQGLLSSVRDILETIRENGYWFSDQIVNATLKAADEL
jgi:predicted nucleic acid-binding protein